MFIFAEIKKIIKNNRGAALVNVIILSTLLASVSALLIRLSESQRKVGTYQGQRVKADKFAEFIRDQLKSPLACTYTFSALTNAGGTVSDIQDKKNQTILTTNQRWLYLKNATGGTAQAVDKFFISPTRFELLDYAAAQNIPAASTTYEDNDTGNTLERGTMTLKVSYETSDIANSNLNDTSKTRKTIGGIKKFLYVPINVTIDTTAGNNIVNCNLSTNIEPDTGTKDKRDFVSVAAADANTILCTTLNGIDIGDGNCRHLTFNDGPNTRQSNGTNADMYALKTEGSVWVETSLINYDAEHADNPNKPNDIRVQGSVDIGVHTGFADASTYDTPMRDETTDGELAVAYSVGIGKDGVAPNFTPEAFNLGFAGAFVLNHSLSIGEDLDAEVDPQNGKLRVQSSLVLGQSGFLNSNNIYSVANEDKGNFAAQNSMSVGNFNFQSELLSATGRTNVLNHVVVGNPATISGTNKNPNNLQGILMGRGIAIGNNSDSKIEIRSGDVGNYSFVSQRNIFLPSFSKIENYTTGTEGEKYVATMGWVAHKIANTTDPSTVADVISVAGEILNGSSSAQKMFASICKGLHIRNADGTFTQGTYSGGQCLLRAKHCSETGKCKKVFAGSGGVKSQARIRTTSGDIRANSSTKGNISGSDDITAGKTFKGQKLNTTGNKIVLNSCQITEWADIAIGTSTTCEYGVTSCSDNYLAIAIRPQYETWTYSTGLYVGGAYTSDQQHVSSLLLDCCKLDNYRCNNNSASPTSPPACGSSTNTCAVGTFLDATDSSVENKWFCTNSPQPSVSCSTPKGIDGSCGTATNTCDAGTFEDFQDIIEEGLSFPQWKCLGINSGDDTFCPWGATTDVGRCPFECSDGSSANIYAGDSCSGDWQTTEQTCFSGTMGPVTDTGSSWKWMCNGSNSASTEDDTDCEMFQQACTTTANTCNDGPAASIDNTDATKYKWTCPGGASCELPRPNNASCGTTEHTCSSTYGSISASNISDTTDDYVWDCIGENGGTSSTGCTKEKDLICNDPYGPGALGDTHNVAAFCLPTQNQCEPGYRQYICRATGWEYDSDGSNLPRCVPDGSDCD